MEPLVTIKGDFNTGRWNDNSVVLIDSSLSKFHRTLILRLSHFQALVQNKASRILDLGCGSGAYLRFFSSLGYVNLYGIEPDKELIKRIPSSLAEVKVGIAQSIPFDTDGFDTVFIYGVLHHLKADREEYKKACDEIYRVLKPGGKVFIMEPGRYFVFRALEIFAKLISPFSKTFRAFSETMKEEEIEQHYFIKNHSFIRSTFLSLGAQAVVDRYFFYTWLFTIQKPVIKNNSAH